MSKMTIIQLLNKIANGEDVPKKIKINSWLWEYKPLAETYYTDKSNENLFEYYRLDKSTLNRELEIIEEDKKIEKLEEYGKWSNEKLGIDEIASNCKELFIIKQKINEIIDKLNEGDKQ